MFHATSALLLPPAVAGRLPAPWPPPPLREGVREWGVGLRVVSVCILLGKGYTLSCDFYVRENGLFIFKRHLQYVPYPILPLGQRVQN